MTLYESLHRMTGEPKIIRIEICSHNIDVLQDFDADQVPPEYFPYAVEKTEDHLKNGFMYYKLKGEKNNVT